MFINFDSKIIFIDEVDSILMSRSEHEHEASRRLKTEFLVQFDGLTTDEQIPIFLIGATNRPQELDAAVLRRFVIIIEKEILNGFFWKSKKVYIPLPSKEARKSLVKQYLKDIKHQIDEESLEQISAILQGF